MVLTLVASTGAYTLLLFVYPSPNECSFTLQLHMQMRMLLNIPCSNVNISNTMLLVSEKHTVILAPSFEKSSFAN